MTCFWWEISQTIRLVNMFDLMQLKVWISSRAVEKLCIIECVFLKNCAKWVYNDSQALIVKFNLALHWAHIFYGNNTSSEI